MLDYFSTFLDAVLVKQAEFVVREVVDTFHAAHAFETLHTFDADYILLTIFIVVFVEDGMKDVEFLQDFGLVFQLLLTYDGVEVGDA